METANTPAVEQTARRGRARGRLRLFGGAILLGLGVLAAIVAVLVIRMSYVPSNLDYSTTRLSENGLYRSTYVSEIDPIKINQLHTWTLHVETADGDPVADAKIAVDGDMPQHGHGLPTQPMVTRNLGNGDYLVEGMKFQMGGWWVVDFHITADGQSDMVRFNLLLK